MKNKFQPGDIVRCDKYGRGTCHQVDPRWPDFMYDFHFEDGTLIWLSKRWAEKNVKLVRRTAEAG